MLTQEHVLADIALFLQGMEKIRTSDLDHLSISKRHVRILDVLGCACETEPVKRWTHVDIQQIMETVALRSNKRYPFLDIVSFTFDLAARGYVDHVEHPEYGDVFAILPKGVQLLEDLGLKYDSMRVSSTPNTYSGVLQ